MKKFIRKKRLWLIPLFIAAVALFAFVTMFLWNSLMPGIFHLPQITYWEALGLLVLSRLLFGFGSGPHWNRPMHHHRGSHLVEKWGTMSPEEREKFREHLREHHGKFWDDFHCDDKSEK